MPRLSKEERDELLARLAADHDDEGEGVDPIDDEGDEGEEGTSDEGENIEPDDTDDAIAVDDGSGDVMIVRGSAATRLIEQYFGSTPTKAASKAPVRPAKATKTAKKTAAPVKRAARTTADPTPPQSGPRYFR